MVATAQHASESTDPGGGLFGLLFPTAVNADIKEIPRRLRANGRTDGRTNATYWPLAVS